MPRDLRVRENQKRAAARREGALARNELRGPSAPREPASGPTSHAVKARSPHDARLVEDFLQRQKVDNGDL